jgi:amino acid transporter
MAVAVRARGVARAPSGRYQREIGLTGLMFASLGSIIGSGWLFGALYAAQQAGPAALLSWGIGAVFVLLLALIHAELGGAYPVAGGSARFPHYSYGSVIGFAIGWIAWIGSRSSTSSASGSSRRATT